MKIASIKCHFGLFFRYLLSNGITITSQNIEKLASNSHFILTQIITRQTHGEAFGLTIITALSGFILQLKEPDNSPLVF